MPDGETTFLAMLLPEVVHEGSFDFFGTIERAIEDEISLDPQVLDLGGQ